MAGDFSALCAQWIQFVMSSKGKPTVNSIFFCSTSLVKMTAVREIAKPWNCFWCFTSCWFKINSDVCPEMDDDYDIATQIQPKEGRLLSALIARAGMNIKDWFLWVFPLSVPGKCLSQKHIPLPSGGGPPGASPARTCHAFASFLGNRKTHWCQHEKHQIPCRCQWIKHAEWRRHLQQLLAIFALNTFTDLPDFSLSCS